MNALLQVALLNAVLAQAPDVTQAADEVPPAAPAPAPAAPPPTATPDQPPTPLAGWVTGEGFRLKSESGDYMLRVGLQAAYRFQPTWENGESAERSSIPFMRPILRGNLYKPWITFWTSMELGGNPPYLLDAYFDVVPISEFGLRAGQQYTPYGRQEQLGPQQLFFPEWSPVADYFWPGRDKGLQVYGLVADKRFEYYLGIFAGSPLRQTESIPGNQEAQFRLAINPLGPTKPDEFPFTAEGGWLPFRFAVGVNGYEGKIQTSVENFNQDNGQLFAEPTGFTFKTWDVGGDVWVQGGPLIFTAEPNWRRIEPQDATPAHDQFGVWGQLLCAIWRDKIAAGVQANWIDPNTAISNDESFEIQGDVNWFIHTPELVLKLRYAHVKQDEPGVQENLPWVPGTTNLLTLQFNLSF
ncbi:MAG: hypothetical protein JST54_11775 [Deltaproteobacteria bacterium]|nr:hypothetical protein [Deltaproteobacteria bacterium]